MFKSNSSLWWCSNCKGNVSIFWIFPSWNWLQEPSKSKFFKTGNSESLYLFNRHNYSKVNNPLNRKDQKVVLWIPWCSHAQSQSTYYSGCSLIQIETVWIPNGNSSSVAGLVFIFLWCTSFLSIITLHMLPNHFLIIILIIKKVLLSSLISRNITFHVAFHVLGYIPSKHKFSALLKTVKKCGRYYHQPLSITCLNTKHPEKILQKLYL